MFYGIVVMARLRMPDMVMMGRLFTSDSNHIGEDNGDMQII